MISLDHTAALCSRITDNTDCITDNLSGLARVAVNFVHGPIKASPIAKKSRIHADRPPLPAADALLFGLAFMEL
ncbi:hypothetical protein QU24_22325 [Pantoea rodasii]|uniref:Uncharacterized protein n=2 Tax=Pantoea TaxID=53335 RepID=A0A0U3JU66_9GAMM|nr:hypothetical protein LK04_09560 [Pantoea vagans]KHJ65864.1 hypothetical protein QU24_22325 [Pantoea rodasii]